MLEKRLDRSPTHKLCMLESNGQYCRWPRHLCSVQWGKTNLKRSQLT